MVKHLSFKQVTVGSIPTGGTMKSWLRWLFRYCMDCGNKLGKTYNRGDVCKKCFDDFNGATLDEIFGK